MGQSNGRLHPRYTVSALDTAKMQLREIFREAAEAGAHDAVIAALASIEARLRTDPQHFGEPLFQYRQSKMTVRCAAEVPLYIVYGVHDEQPVVVVRRVLSLTVGAT